ncbi:MAG: ABC-2 family transporter protein [Verrucomicrobia bacterium]|nr:ABC-2 family transporter protein [Verrucomicrobiota bacterium]
MRLTIGTQSAMTKYLHVLNIGIQNTLVYRVNFFFRAAFGLVPLMAMLFVWRTIYEGKGADARVGAYTLAQMVSYYLVVTLVDMLTAVAEDDWQIAADIKDGNISQFLVKPVDYLTYRLCLFLSGRLIYTASALVPVGLFLFVQRENFVMPSNFGTYGAFLVSVAMTALLQFLLSYTMALLAFWVTEVATFIFILFAFEYIAGGHLFPLDILPTPIATALNYTPFPYQLYFPVSVFLGRVTGGELARGLVIQAFWVVAAYALARFVWHRGIKKYSAVGG